MRMIEKARELIEDLHAGAYDDEYIGTDAYLMLDELCDALEKADAQMPSWIPVSERLPEKYQSVLAARQAYAPNKQHYVCEAWLNDFNWKNSCGTMENVTHWMPLPEAPKGE